MAHKHFKTGCEFCEEGEWRFSEAQSDVTKIGKTHLSIFRMPMNNVVWQVDDDDD